MRWKVLLGIILALSNFQVIKYPPPGGRVRMWAGGPWWDRVNGT